MTTVASGDNNVALTATGRTFVRRLTQARKPPTRASTAQTKPIVWRSPFSLGIIFRPEFGVLICHDSAYRQCRNPTAEKYSKRPLNDPRQISQYLSLEYFTACVATVEEHCRTHLVEFLPGANIPSTITQKVLCYQENKSALDSGITRHLTC